MLTRGQTLDMSPIGAVFRIRKTPEETNGQALEMEWELLPRSAGTPVHIHPFASETYRILEGTLEVNVNGQWKKLQKGEEMTIDKGVPHTFRNPIDGVTRVYNTHTPAMQFDAYFEGLNNIVNKLSSGRKDGLKLNLNAMMHLCMLMKKYPAEIKSVSPANFIVSFMNSHVKLKALKV